MAYCAQADIEELLPESELIELTDDVGAGQVDTSVITRAIADADDEVNSYLQKRYTVPLSPVPGLVRKLSVDLAVFNLFSRRGIDEPVRTQRYENSVKLLDKLAKGLASLGVEPPPAETHGEGIEATRSKSDRVFTRGDSETSGSLDNF